MGEPETRGSIEITTEERNELWNLADFALNGAAEGLSCGGDVNRDKATELKQWFHGLDAMGYERQSEQGCSIPLSLPFMYVVDAAEKQAWEILDDNAKTMAEKFKGMTAPAIEELFLPPAEGDREGGYIVGYVRVKAIRERMEAAEPGLRRGG
jgi:hypothetical protein